MLVKSLLDRRSERRENEQELKPHLNCEKSQFLLSYKGRFILNSEDGCCFAGDQINRWPELSDLELTSKWDSCHIYLGEHETRQYFVIQLNQLPSGIPEQQLFDLRALSFISSPFELEILHYAQGLINWHFTHRYCAKCGSSTMVTQVGHSRTCNNGTCGKEHFPRIEPAVIFLVETKINNTPHVLLARQANWPDKRYSILAGFTEHGESLEVAVKREAFEEVGLKVKNIQYQGSQPWPFPASLMLGFTCETNDQNIRLIDQELESAIWLSAEEITEKVKSKEILMPYSVSISWHILDQWFKAQSGISLKNLTN